MKLKIISTSLVLSCVFCYSSVSAETFNYSYIEGGVADYIDEADGVTFLVGGSYNVASNFNLLMEYSTTTIASEGSIDLDYDTLGLGVGYHTSINDKADFTANIKYVSIDLSLNEGFATAELADADGLSVGIGVRYKLSDKIEANINADYIEIDDASDSILTVGGRYFFSDSLSAALSYRTGDDDGVAGTLRYSF